MKLPELRHVLANCPKAKIVQLPLRRVQGQVRRGQPAVMCRAARSGSHLGRRRLSPVRQFCRFCRTQPSHLNFLDRRCATPPAPRSLIGRTQSPSKSFSLCVDDFRLSMISSRTPQRCASLSKIEIIWLLLTIISLLSGHHWALSPIAIRSRRALIWLLDSPMPFDLAQSGEKVCEYDCRGARRRLGNRPPRQSVQGELRAFLCRSQPARPNNWRMTDLYWRYKKV